MQSMTSYRRRRYIVEKHKIPTRRHKRTSSVKKFPLPCLHGRAVPLHIGAQMGRPLRQRPAAKKRASENEARFFVCAKAASFRPAAQTLSLAGGRRRRKPSLPAGEKVLKRSLLEDFSLLYRLFTGLRAASAAAVHRQRYRRAVVGGIWVGRTARDRRGVLERRIRAGAQHTRKLQRDRLSRRQIADVDASRP